MKNFLLIVILLVSAAVHSETLGQPLIKSNWRTYIFVSTKMPRANLISLAREAVRTKSILVLNGFNEKEDGIREVHRMVSEINAQCCQKQEVSWVIHPKLFTLYGIKAAPAFVIARSESLDRQEDVAIVYGDMTLANALKYIAQESKFVELRQRAAMIYALL